MRGLLLGKIAILRFSLLLISTLVCTEFYAQANSNGGKNGGVITLNTGLPATLTRCEGGDITLSVSATADSPLMYFWYKDGAPIGTNSPSISLFNISLSDSGIYTVKIDELSTPLNSFISACTVKVNPKPRILVDANGTASPVCQGSMVSIFADISNANVEWKKGATVLATGTPSYMIMSADTNHKGSYILYGKALESCKDTFTSAYVLDVKSHATITTQPMGKALRDNANMNYVMKVVAAGSGPFMYQWFKDGTSIAGENSDTLKIVGYTTAKDSGQYYVEVSTAAPCNDLATSNFADLTSTLCPIILSNKFANGAGIRNIATNDTTLGFCKGESISIQPSTLGAQDSNFRWYLNGVELTTNRGYSTFSSPAGVVDSFIIGKYVYELLPDPGVTGCPSTFSDTMKVFLNNKPSFTLQPMGPKSCSATFHTLSVNATDASSYQWFKNNNLVVAATDMTYIATVDATPNEYYVNASNIYCSPTSSNKVLVRQINPATMAAIKDGDRYKLTEQCTDGTGWTYYAHHTEPQDILFAIRKNGNMVKFMPDVTTTLGYIKEIAPMGFDKKGVFIGSRMFNINIDSGEKITNAYDVKFYFNHLEQGKGEKQFLELIQNKMNSGGIFKTNLPTNELSFITSTQQPMDTSLIFGLTNSTFLFPNTVVTDKSFGMDNNQKFVQINKLVASKGGGTFYFHYYRSELGQGGISQSNALGANIYPTMTQGKVTASFEDALKSNYSISLIDYMGREVSNLSFKKSVKEVELDYSHLANGNYILRINNEFNSINTKITINK